MYVNSVCLDNPVPCCLCEDTGMPGKVDPITKECLCKCFCDPPDNKIPSVKVSALFRAMKLCSKYNVTCMNISIIKLVNVHAHTNV